MYWLIRMLAFHSNVSAVPISGCLRRLLLSLFIKLDNAPKCGVAWFIMKDFISFGFFWELSSDWLCASCQPIKIINQSWTCLQLKQYFSSICYYQPFWNCQVIQTWISYLAVKRAHRCKLNVLLHGFFSACQIRLWKEMRWHRQWCSSPIFMWWSAHLSW